MDKLPQFKIRASATSKITGGTIGLTDTQKATLADYESREQGTHPKGLKLTAKMELDLAELQHKRLNPELPQGLKTYCKKWLKETKYKRWKQINSRYIKKGNTTEQDGHTMICVNLGLGYNTSCDIRKSNDFMTGICDLDFESIDTIVDNKSSWDLDTFPMYETEIPNKDYEEQIQGYMELYNRSKGIVVYTLIDCPEDILLTQFPYNGTPNEKQDIAINLIYTQKYWDEMKAKYFPEADYIEFVEIPEKDRVKPFYFNRDREFIKEAKLRVDLCQKYIETLI